MLEGPENDKQKCYRQMKGGVGGWGAKPRYNEKQTPRAREGRIHIQIFLLRHL